MEEKGDGKKGEREGEERRQWQQGTGSVSSMGG